MKKLLLLKKGVDVIRGTSKKKGESSAIGNIINEKFQGRYFFERAKTKKKQIKKELEEQNHTAKSVPDSSAKFGIKNLKKLKID